MESLNGSNLEPRINTDEHGWEKTTEVVIGCAFRVANTLGAGFLEKVYENALSHELRKSGLKVQQQFPIAVRYDGAVVGEYAADLVVEDVVLVELKACRALDDIHMAQCLNYLKALSRPVCLLINFGVARIKVRRILNPAHPQAWVHPADNIHPKTGEDLGCFAPDPIRVHPCPSVVPHLSAPKVD